jgi:hypothetical protein
MTGSNTRRAAGLLAVGLLIAGLVYAGTSGFCRWADDKTNGKANTSGGESTVGREKLFASWPPNVKPDAVLVLSGQTFGFLQPCGCTRPQQGGLERRANFVAQMRAKGWHVAGFDLGDVYPVRTPTGPSGIVASPEQSLLNYVTTMTALRDMGYVAVGLGKTEFAGGLYPILAGYALQKEQPPFILAANVTTSADGKPIPREQAFPGPGKRPMVGLAEIADVNGVHVGVAGVVGKTVAEEVAKADPQITFLDAQTIIGQAVAGINAAAKKPAVNVLLFQGSSEHARKVAKDWPQFQVILCLADDPEPPQFPQYVEHADGKKTMVIQVGHKGKYVGTVGLFRNGSGGFDLKYQLVPLGEEYITPNNPADEKANRALAALEDYAAQVKARNLLAKVVQRPHGDQIQMPQLNLTYVGSERCMGCHAAEYTRWKDTHHSHAMETLETKATRPGLRNVDGECVVCHTVGFGYKTGYENDQKSQALRHVGCESCHGPGSGHMSAPRNRELLALMSPWKENAADKLPDPATVKKLADMNPAERGQVQLPVAQQRVINAVSKTCMSCHDSENDPHFDLFRYWPKVNHTPVAPGGALPPIPK